MSRFRIALLPGDGIGPECMAATRLVLERLVAGHKELVLETTEHRAGAELYRDTGETLPNDVLDDCLEAWGPTVRATRMRWAVVRRESPGTGRRSFR